MQPAESLRIIVTPPDCRHTCLEHVTSSSVDSQFGFQRCDAFEAVFFWPGDSGLGVDPGVLADEFEHRCRKVGVPATKATLGNDGFTRIGFGEEPARSRSRPFQTFRALQKIFHGANLFENIVQGWSCRELEPCRNAGLRLYKRRRFHDDPGNAGRRHRFHQLAGSLRVKRRRIDRRRWTKPYTECGNSSTTPFELAAEVVIEYIALEVLDIIDPVRWFGQGVLERSNLDALANRMAQYFRAGLSSGTEDRKGGTASVTGSASTVVPHYEFGGVSRDDRDHGAGTAGRWRPLARLHASLLPQVV